MHLNDTLTERRDWLISVSSYPGYTIVFTSATAHEALLYGLSHRTPGVEEFITITEMDDAEIIP